MALEDLTTTLNSIVDSCETTNRALDVAANLQAVVETNSQAALPKKLTNAAELPTEELLRQALFALLTGQSNNVLSTTGKPVPTSECNDPLQNEQLYDNTFSVGKHIVRKEKITEFPTKGIEIKLEPQIDPITKLTKYNSQTIEQQDVQVIYSPDGDITNTELETKNSQMVTPHNYVEDPALQSIINSLVVTISNSVAEAVTKVIMSKIEENQTEIEIEWDPAMNHSIKLVTLPTAMYNAVGPVSPGSINVQGQFTANEAGTISFKNGEKYKHKCRISFGKDKL